MHYMVSWSALVKKKKKRMCAMCIYMVYTSSGLILGHLGTFASTHHVT